MSSIFSIDPGPTESAYTVLSNGRIIAFGKVSNQQMRDLLMLTANPNFKGVVAIEEIASYGMPVGREVFQTVHWSGRFTELAERNGARVISIPRGEIKIYLCGSAKAKDANIRQSLLDKVGPQGTKKHPGPTYGISKDVWAALAVAVTVEFRLNNKTNIDSILEEL